MIRRNTFVMLASFALLALVASSAQAGGSVFAGLSLPMGTFSDYADMGFHGGLTATSPVGPNVEIGGMGSFSTWGHSFADESWTGLEGLAIAKISSPAGVFGLVGMGVGHLKVASASDTKFAFALGGGYTMTKVELMAMYHSIALEGDPANWISLSVGLGF